MKNKIYINKKNKPKNNNQKTYNIKENDKIIDYDIDNNKNVYDIINDLLNENGYIFNKKVDIITNNKVYHSSIANVLKDKVITMDKDIIYIRDIKDIKRVI